MLINVGRVVYEWSETASKSDQLLLCQLLAREDQHNVLQPSRVNILPLCLAQRVAQIYLSDFRPNRMGHRTNFHERLPPGLAAVGRRFSGVSTPAGAPTCTFDHQPPGVPSTSANCTVRLASPPDLSGRSIG